MLNVMIVDNETAIRKGLIRCIRWEDLGCQITAQAEDGVAALEQMTAARPDIVISDIRMPGMDGLELAHTISEQYPRTKVIILTGYPDFAYAQRAIQYHVVDFVLKPTTVESLTQAVEKAKAAIAADRSSQDLQQELASTSEQNLQLHRSMLLHDLIHRIDCSQLYVFNRLAQLGMDLSSYFVLKLHIAPLEGESLTEVEFSDNLTQSQEILADCLSGYPLYYIARAIQDCYAVVCAAGDAPITALCREAVNIVGSLPRFLFSVGISNCRTDPIVLADAADEAAQAVQFASFSPEQPVVHFSELHSFPPQITDAIYNRLRDLKTAIDSRDDGGVGAQMDGLFGFLRTHKLPPDTVRNVCVYLHQFSMELQFPQSGGQVIAEDGVNVLKRILETQSISEMEEVTRAFAERMLEPAQGGGANVDKLILQVKSYVDTHYSEALSLERLAQQFYLSPSYLSRIFKRDTGVNLSTYLQNARIDAAKTLLRTTDLKSYEVAERVGITDPVYFSRIFKKVTGLKPKDYRHSAEK